MALTKCRECGTEISSSARRCPKCGKVRTTGSSVVWTLIILLIVLALLWNCRF